MQSRSQDQGKNPKRRQLRIEMPSSLSATYANTVMISHTAHEVIFDFIHILPNITRASVQERVVMTPMHAKLFLNALRDNIERYEQKNGEIKIPQRPESLADQLFRGVRPADDDDGNDDDNG